jgi:hypothetical protein
MSRELERRLEKLERSIGGPRGGLRVGWRHTRWIGRRAVEFEHVDLPPSAARRYEELSRERLPLLEELGLLEGYPEDEIEARVVFYTRLRRIFEGMLATEETDPQVRRDEELWEKLCRCSNLGWEMGEIVRAEIAAAERQGR